jgi:predicted membrane channel-forming protein YqfA (hemolysin III family)
MRKRRKEELYKKQERIDAIINWGVGVMVFVLGAAILGGIAWILGSYQGRW